ncbi:MAG: hypothetical protein HYX75_15125 [Acidobacteria bacterium]|nr:hypothetical protein [Acidobacteriota bacterium]
MPIVKAGFSAGLHGRASPASWGRRVAYLGRDQDQAALLLARDGTISKTGALAELGGKQAEYHEAIVAWTPNECRALAERFGSAEAAKEGIARSIARNLAGEDGHYVVAIHAKRLSTGEQAWHLHVAIQGREPAQFLGARGRAQRAVDAAWRECAPKLPINDWTKHAQFVCIRAELCALQTQQNKLSGERRNALRRARGPAKLEVDKEYASKMQALVERRHALELAAAQARYDARGIGGGAEHLVEIERADMRRAQALSVIERRSEAVRARGGALTRTDRLWRSARAQDAGVGRGIAAALRGVQRAQRGISAGISGMAASAAMSALPAPMRAMVTPFRLAGRLMATTTQPAQRDVESPLAPLRALRPVMAGLRCVVHLGSAVLGPALAPAKIPTEVVSSPRSAITNAAEHAAGAAVGVVGGPIAGGAAKALTAVLRVLSSAPQVIQEVEI